MNLLCPIVDNHITLGQPQPLLDEIPEGYSVANNMSDCSSFKEPSVRDLVVDGEVIGPGADDVEGVAFGVEGGQAGWGRGFLGRGVFEGCLGLGNEAGLCGRLVD